MISCKHFKCVLETLNKISTGQQKFLSNPKMSIVGIAKGRQKTDFLGRNKDFCLRVQCNHVHNFGSTAEWVLGNVTLLMA